MWASPRSCSARGPTGQQRPAGGMALSALYALRQPSLTSRPAGPREHLWALLSLQAFPPLILRDRHLLTPRLSWARACAEPICAVGWAVPQISDSKGLRFTGQKSQLEGEGPAGRRTPVALNSPRDSLTLCTRQGPWLPIPGAPLRMGDLIIHYQMNWGHCRE